jgi:hypothetical protein
MHTAASGDHMSYDHSYLDRRFRMFDATMT